MLEHARALALALCVLTGPAAADHCNITKLQEALTATLAARDHLFEFEETEPVNAEALGSLHAYIRLLHVSKHMAQTCEHGEAKSIYYRLNFLERIAVELLAMANKAEAADFAWMIKREVEGWAAY